MKHHTSGMIAALPVQKTADHWVSLFGALLIAAISLVAQGFAYGIANNVFHIPFVLEWNLLPQFADDAFYQTLDGFTSGLWWLVRLFATEQSLPALFLTIHTVGRILAVIALEHALRTVLPSLKNRLLALLLATLSLTAMPISPVGAQDLLVGYLTHSAFLWPFFVGALVCAMRDRWRFAAFLAGLTFLLNAFVGVWCAVALAGLAFFGQRRPSIATQAQAALAFICTAAPVVVWIMSGAEGFTSALDFSFRDYVRTYYAAHFLIEVATWPALLNVTALILLALFCTFRLGSREWSVAIASFSLVLVVGAIAPYLVDSRLVFNLHLLRVDGAIIFLGMPLVLAYGLRLLLHPATSDERVVGCTLLMSCVTGEYAVGAFVWGTLIVISDRRISTSIALLALLALGANYALALDWFAVSPTLAAGFVFGAGAIAVAGDRASRYEAIYTAIAVAVFLAVLVVGVRSGLMGSGAAVRSLAAIAFLVVIKHRSELTALVRLRPIQLLISPPVAGATFIGCLMLLQVAGIWSEAPGRRSLTDRDRDWIDLVARVREAGIAGPVLIPVIPSDTKVDHDFQLHSKTSVWVDWRQGAAVMWDPSFHAVWRQRFEAVRQLQQPTEYEVYARKNRIPLFVVDQQQCPEDSAAIYRNAHFALCQPKPSASS